MNVMITGAEGFIGGVLAKHCANMGCSVLGIGIGELRTDFGGASFEHCDVRDASRLSHLLSAFRPQRIFHLAAQSFPTVSLLKPLETFDANAGGTINLFECLRSLDMTPVVVVACSSAEYGPVAAEDLPVRESHPLRPLHPYGVSKVAQDLLAAQYFTNYGMPAVRIRIFNTTDKAKRGMCAPILHAGLSRSKRGSALHLCQSVISRPVGPLSMRATWCMDCGYQPGIVPRVTSTTWVAIRSILFSK